MLSQAATAARVELQAILAWGRDR